ncbi:hypothetical protein Poli38472_003714 [Pythium oligandrum]|uniref:AB hydrolase-1 domain-containing protein n=1 Tax=Pythium oligandrum TaxID=41045 RepID=A0A8K1CLY0_PYTOL|nr:hypothetical protein Poli38472_003714 [Pythium oligandrum]|eukprot:TMW65949.1 hypothetical protein Poli38472_003714 [Pythium oligandrum]
MKLQLGLQRVATATGRRGSRAQSTLSYRVYEDTSSGKTPTKTAFVMHGILGNKMNWRTFSLKLANAKPDWRFVTLDHRAHGDSPSLNAPHTVSACSEDLLRLADELQAEPDVVIGHSFGGKVAIGYLEEAQRHSRKLPEQVWALDSLPGDVTTDYSNRKLTASIERVLPVLKTIPLPIHSKNKLIEDLQAGGLSLGEAQWLTTNLKLISTQPEAYDWKMDVPVIEELFASFLATDMWPIVLDSPPETEVHFVRAERSKMWTPRIIEYLPTLKDKGVHYHLLPKADHWVHIDNPAGLLDILLKNLPA